MLRVVRQLKTQRTRAVLAIGVLAATGAIAAAAAPAQAEYYWGCTYSWGSPCYEPRSEPINYLITMDPDHAVGAFGGAKPANGYKVPKYDGRERCVGSAIWNGGTVAPWAPSGGAWGESVVTYPSPIQGQAMIGTCQEYYDIALYQMVNWTESF